MCDCSPKNKNGTAFEPRPVTTLPFFETCSPRQVQRTDYTKSSLHNVRQAAANAEDAKTFASTGLATEKVYGICNASVTSSSDEESSDNSDTLLDDDSSQENDSECAIGCRILDDGEDCICAEEKSDKDLDFEHTLVIIKPESKKCLSELDRLIREEGFEVQQKKNLRLTSEQVAEFYVDNYVAMDFTNFVSYMTSGPLVVEILARKNAIQKWQLLMGPAKETEARLYFPDSLRGQCRNSQCKNSYHGSATPQEAEREIRFFFPDFILEPILKGQDTETYLRKNISDFLAKGLATCCTVKPLEPILWLANWLLCNNPNIPKAVPMNYSK